MLYDPKWEVKIKENIIRRILYEAADILEKRGWCQGSLTDGHGGRCALGAISLAAVGELVDKQRAADHLSKYLGQGVAAWNDMPSTTLSEVTTTLRHVASQS